MRWPMLRKEIVSVLISEENKILKEVNEFLISEKRQRMLTGDRYYDGVQDILLRARTVIGKNGKLEIVENLPNNKIVDNQYAKMVDQKTNYLVGKDISVDSENEGYVKNLNDIFNKEFMRKMKFVTQDSYNFGIGWMFPQYDDRGKLTFRRYRSYEIDPHWEDVDHTILKYAYHVWFQKDDDDNLITYIEHFTQQGLYYYTVGSSGRLEPAEPYYQPYLYVDGKPFVWDRIPLIPFKSNAKEIPLICRVKSIQDGLNLIESNFQNSMEEDVRNTILVLKNYDGQNLAEFRKNLAEYGAVKVKTIDGSQGDVTALRIEVKADNYKAIIDMFKKAIIENCKGFDAKDARLEGEPNQMNIESMYSDIDLDANNTENEFQASFEKLLFFINSHLMNTGKGDFFDTEVKIIFNRDILISESETIENCVRSVGILPDETIIANHPWVSDPASEFSKLQKQREEEMKEYEFGGGKLQQGAGNSVGNNSSAAKPKKPDQKSDK